MSSRHSVIALSLSVLWLSANLVSGAPVPAQGCDVPPGPAPVALFEHVWGGAVNDVFASEDGVTAWVVEDGGRIRIRKDLGESIDWQLQDVPFEVQDTLRGVHFLDEPGTAQEQIGWAVGDHSKIVRTTDGGQLWTLMRSSFVPPLPEPLDELENFYDVHFLDLTASETVDEANGCLVGRHTGVWRSADGGATWTRANHWRSEAEMLGGGNPITIDGMERNGLEFYGVDVVLNIGDVSCVSGDDGSFLGIAIAEPGLVFRSTNSGEDWVLAFDVRDLCEDYLLPCEQTICNRPVDDVPLGQGIDEPDYLEFEPWDVEIGANGLIVMVGGIGVSCGMIFTSNDYGCTWAYERHECSNAPTCSPPSGLVYNLDNFRTLYGVGIFPGTDAAVAAGYNGQHVVRDTLASPIVWRDHSSFGDFEFENENATIFPLYAADAVTSGSTNIAIVGGLGNHIRRSEQDGEFSGETWEDDVPTIRTDVRNSPIHFFEGRKGVQAGQFFRRAQTTDGGTKWIPDRPLAEEGTGTLHGMAFASDGLTGVVVGDHSPAGSDTDFEELPKILYTTDRGRTSWVEPMDVTFVCDQSTYSCNAQGKQCKRLRDVAWRDGDPDEFWAVGQKGLVLVSDDKGVTWTQEVVTGLACDTDVDFFGVATAGDLVFVVGKGLGGTAVAYVHSTVTGSWTPLALEFLGAPAPDIKLLTAVDATLDGTGGVVAYAVGRYQPPGDRRGVVFRYENGVLEFTECLPACESGFETIPVLAEPLGAVTVVEGSLDVWIGGACGRVWQLDQSAGAGGVWYEHKSLTDGDIESLSFIAEDLGYIGTFRGPTPQSTITRYDATER